MLRTGQCKILRSALRLRRAAQFDRAPTVLLKPVDSTNGGGWSACVRWRRSAAFRYGHETRFQKFESPGARTVQGCTMYYLKLKLERFTVSELGPGSTLALGLPRGSKALHDRPESQEIDKIAAFPILENCSQMPVTSQ